MARAVSEGNWINNGLPGEVMRKSMENKNLLAQKGAMYIGKGTAQTVTIADSSSSGITGDYSVVETEALNPPEANGTYVLKCVVSGGSVSVFWESTT